MENLNYVSIERFRSGEKAWGYGTFTVEGVENTPCAGGIYL